MSHPPEIVHYTFHIKGVEEDVNLGNILKKDSRTVRGTENVKVSDSMTKGERLYKLQNEIRNLKPGQTLQGTVVGRNGNTV